MAFPCKCKTPNVTNYIENHIHICKDCHRAVCNPNKRKMKYTNTISDDLNESLPNVQRAYIRRPATIILACVVFLISKR